MKHNITIDDLIYLYEEPKVSINYRHRNPRAKSFFQGLSKKKCRALIIDTKTNNVIDSVPYPTKERVSELVQELGANRKIVVKVPSFNSMFNWLFKTTKIKAYSASNTSGGLYAPSHMSKPFIMISIGKSEKYPESIKKYCEFSKSKSNIWTPDKEKMSFLHSNHIILFDATREDQFYDQEIISRLLNIIKMVYVNEPKEVMLYSHMNIENSEQIHVANLFRFLNNMPLEFYR